MYECYFIGTTSLLKECVSLAQKFDFRVLGIFSDDLTIRKWCQSVNLTCKPFRDIQKITVKYDYLFSIVNPKIITAADLSKVKKQAINYHDSLLPKYAGVNATTWAILNNEKKHGISWHLIAEGIDTGDIIQQEEISVDNNETAFSLNLKCYNEAINSFPTLVDSLIKNSVKTRKQNLALRSYYSQEDRPFGNGFINWNDSSENIARLIRALDFGISINPKTTSKVIINNKPYSIKKFKVINTTKKIRPGTIVSFNDRALVIATLDNLISIEEIKTMDGIVKALDEMEIHSQKSIKVFNNEELEEIQSLAKRFSKYENYWIRQIKNISLNSKLLPAYQHENQKIIKTAWKLVIPKEALSTFSKDDNELIKSVIAAISFYFYKINNYESITLKIVKYFNYHLNSYPINLPCNIAVTPSDNIFSDILNYINELLNSHVYEPDLFCRNDELTHSLSLIPVLIIPPSDKNHNKQAIDHQGLIIEIKLSENEIILTGKSTRKFSFHIESLLKFMPEHLKNIISLINAKQDPSHYSILSKEEETLLKSFNNTKEKIDNSHKTILQKILLRGEENPDAIAIVECGKSYSYKELLNLSNVLAHQIKNNYRQHYNRELSTQKVFTIHCQHGLSYILAVLATLRLGCIFSPIDPSYPIKRIQYVVSDSECEVVLNDVLDKKLEVNATFIVNIELVKLKQEKLLNEIHLLEAQHLLYLMYTSGSTGEPKGVKVSQINFNNLLAWYTQLCLTQKDKTFVISSFAFDLTQKNIIAPLTVGGQVHFRENKQYYEPKEIINHIDKYKITHINCTSSLFFHLTENISLLPKLKSLSQVVLGVGLFTGHNLLEFYQQNPKVKIYNSYGPAECTDVCSFYRITHKDIINDNPIPIGIPISNNNIFILDKYNQLMPFGIPGELCVTGINVSHGYFNKSDLTKKVFLKSILSLSDYEGYHYHTGDVAYLAMNKNLYFLNRTDTQIKIRGYRVELGEIEAVLIKHPNIKESKVICREINDNKNLIAFVSTITSNIQPEEISNHLKEYLPHYMIPHFIHIIDQLPLNIHNKIDQEALFKLAAENDISNTIIPPTTPIERSLCQLWSKFLNKEMETTHINFFEAGGDSLLATKLAYAIEEECNVIMKTIDIYEHPVLHDLATFISNKRPNDDDLVIHPSAILKSQWVSEQQKNIIFVEKTHPKFSHLYNSMYCFKINGNFKIDVLKESIEIVYSSLPILKENYAFDAYNIIKTYNDTPLDISILEVSEDKIEDYITNKKINISKDNLLSVYIFITSSTDILLYFKIHHCISDAESMGIICRYISEVYEALLKQNPLPKIDQVYNYDQYATWQNKYFSTHQYQEKVAVYANRFKDLTPTSLPYDTFPSEKFIIASQCDFFDLGNKELYSQIFTFCHQHKVSYLAFFGL